MQKICVGVSGGIDSAATVMKLKEMGYDPFGVTFSVDGIWDCVALDALEEQLAIPIYRVDVSKPFQQKIIAPFVETYMAGGVPSPCVLCNSLIKWNTIQQNGVSNGVSLWATGHYCRKEFYEGNYYVVKGVDSNKDQSYYLWQLSQDILKGAIMPLGDFTKEQIRDYVTEKGLHYLAKKKESMGVCFLGKGGYSELLRSKVADIDSLKGGRVVDRDNNFLCNHNGYPFYTLAQKKGLSIPSGMSVVEIDVTQNLIIVASPEELYCDTFILSSYKIVNQNEFFSSKLLEVKVRGVGRNPNGYCSVKTLSDGGLEVKLLNDRAWAMAKGQPAVFYIGDRVVGGGIVRQTPSTR